MGNLAGGTKGSDELYSGGTENNLLLGYYNSSYYHTVNVEEPLTDGACIGVTTNKYPADVTGGKIYISKTAANEDYSRYFVPDDSDLGVYTDGDNKIYLAVGPRITREDNGDTLNITLPETSVNCYVVVARYQENRKASGITILEPGDFTGGIASVSSNGAALVKAFVLDQTTHAPLYPAASWRPVNAG